jgi:serine/threonine-protein kinase
MNPGANADITQRLPELVGRYEVLLPIASGGMATVYLARTVGVGGFEREVALKLTHAHLRQNREFALDLIEEAKLAVRIRHQNVVSVLDVGEDQLGVFLVMDYIEGDTLAALSRAAASHGGLLPVRIGMRLLVDVLSGLHAAHELRDDAGRPVGLVHRDFSPQNILVGMDGHARLTDFGIARAATRLGHTSTGVVKGKLGYMSPEQARGQPLDRRSDIWAAGVVAWEVCTGRKLYDLENEAATLLRIVSERPPPARSVNLDIPEQLDQAIASALQLDRQQRCPNALTFARQLAAAAQANNMLAEVEEVAGCVDELIAPRIERRRARIQQVLELRSKAIPVSVRMPSPGQPSPEAAPRAPPEPDDVATTEAEQRTATTARSEVADASLSRVRLQRVWGFRIAVLLALLSIFPLAAWWIVRQPAADPPAVSDPGPGATQRAAVAPPAESSLAPPPAALELISFSFDVPVRAVRVDGQHIGVEPPSRTLGLQVTAEQISRGVTIEATAADGRVARAISEAGQHTVSLRFASARGPATMGPATATGKLPLAPNPYATSR